MVNPGCTSPTDPTRNRHWLSEGVSASVRRGGRWSTRGWRGRGLERRQEDGASDTSLRSDTHFVANPTPILWQPMTSVN